MKSLEISRNQILIEYTKWQKYPENRCVGATSPWLPCHHTLLYKYTQRFRTRKTSDHTHKNTLKKHTVMASRVLVHLSVVLFALIVSSGSICKADESSESVIEHVLTLDHSNLTQVVAKYDFIVVEFYAPW